MPTSAAFICMAGRLQAAAAKCRHVKAEGVDWLSACKNKKKRLLLLYELYDIKLCIDQYEFI